MIDGKQSLGTDSVQLSAGRHEKRAEGIEGVPFTQSFSLSRSQS